MSLGFIEPRSNTRQSHLFRQGWPTRSVSLILVALCGGLSQLHGGVKVAELWRQWATILVVALFFRSDREARFCG